MEHCSRPFLFDRDTFAYANELVWEYRFDPVTGAMTTRPNRPAPAYTHRCFVMVRSARQFHYHAVFFPESPPAEAETCRRLIREVVSRSPRRPSPAATKVPVPGFDGLRSLSRAHESLLKAECGGAWQSYCLRSHWRMILPVSRRHQARTARRLTGALAENRAPIVHLFRFPQVTINHGIILLRLRQTDSAIQFAAYDPNLPDRPTELAYDRAGRTFTYPPNRYWAGGRVDVIEVYKGWF